MHRVAGASQFVREGVEARGLTLCVVEEQNLRHLASFVSSCIVTSDYRSTSVVGSYAPSLGRYPPCAKKTASLSDHSYTDFIVRAADPDAGVRALATARACTSAVSAVSDADCGPEHNEHQVTPLGLFSRRDVSRRSDRTVTTSENLCPTLAFVGASNLVFGVER